MTPRTRFITALERKPLTGLVPHFELVFFLTLEAFGKVHPSHRNYGQWFQMTGKERQLHRMDMARLFIDTAERYEHSAIFLHPNPGTLEEIQRLIDCVRDISGDTYFLMIHGDATYGIPSGSDMMGFIERIADEPEQMKQTADRRVNEALEKAEALARHGGLDGFALCADYCFNTGPFLSPSMFSEYVTPYLERLTKGYRDLGFYVIKHTDGNIMPILDQLVQTEPHALHSLDPQGDIDLAEVKRSVGNRVCLIGNVHCGFLQTGTNEEVVTNVRDTLRAGMPGGGYIFSTSNCVYTGLPLERYELMLDIWREEGMYR